MNPLKLGTWRVHAVSVDSRPAGETSEFHTLISTESEIRLEPAGVRFQLHQATARSAILESRSQIFFADFTIRGDELTLNLSRPSFSEKVSLKATFESEIVDATLAKTA